MIEPGTLAFTDVMGPLVNVATGLKWTHVLIYLDPWYEATVPKVKRSEGFQGRYVYVAPPDGLDVDAMRKYADSQLGRPYGLRGYLNPKLYGKTRGVYCSEFACYVLRAGGLQIPKRAGYTPDRLYTVLTGRRP